MNPWEKISLDDYEKHMESETVMQLQALDHLMEQQFRSYPVSSVMILGIAGGNGLSHFVKDQKIGTTDAAKNQTIEHIIGVDINQEYLNKCRLRYLELEKQLELLRLGLIDEYSQLPHAEYVVANLLIEYIGYEGFQNVIRQVRPLYVSCGIQINTGEEFVSDSPYLHAFDALNQVHHQILVNELIDAMKNIGYLAVTKEEIGLPNAKKIVRLDFELMEVLLR